MMCGTHAQPSSKYSHCKYEAAVGRTFPTTSQVLIVKQVTPARAASILWVAGICMHVVFVVSGTHYGYVIALSTLLAALQRSLYYY